MATPTILGTVASKIPLLSTELNSLANNAQVLSSVGGSSGVFANVSTSSGGGGYILGRLHLHLASVGSAFTANSGVSIWFLNAADGSTYESGSSSITPARAPDVVMPVIAQTAAQDVEMVCPMPIGATFKVLAQNYGTGQTFASSGNTLDWYPTTDTIPSI